MKPLDEDSDDELLRARNKLKKEQVPTATAAAAAEADGNASESISEVSTISSEGSMDEEESWVSSFCNVIGHEYFAEVAEDFIEDDFNLTGLAASVPMFVPPLTTPLSHPGDPLRPR